MLLTEKMRSTPPFKTRPCSLTLWQLYKQEKKIKTTVQAFYEKFFLGNTVLIPHSVYSLYSVKRAPSCCVVPWVDSCDLVKPSSSYQKSISFLRFKFIQFHSSFPSKVLHEIPVARINEKLKCSFLDQAANWKKDAELWVQHKKNLVQVGLCALQEDHALHFEASFS